MTEAIEKLSAEELDALAGEIVRNLDGAVRSTAASDAAEETAAQTALQRLLVQAAAALVPTLDAAGAAVSVQLAPSKAGRGISAPETARGAMDSRFEETQLQPKSEMSAAAFPQYVSGKKQDIAALSEYFRRDSRRYDVGFERF